MTRTKVEFQKIHNQIDFSHKNFVFMLFFIHVNLVLSIFLSTLALYLGGLRAAKVMHNSVFKCVMKAPMSFFETTPLGRIINRLENLHNFLRYPNLI